jgi:CRISPR-associated endonuclease/helicase Cas3
MADQLVSNIPELDTEDRDQIFLELVRGWQEQHHVEVHYRKPNADRTTKLVIAPWWFEPAVWSDAFYLICGINKSGEIYEPITLKLDRIQSVKQLSTHFERPAGQEITTYIENTWGIWTSDEKTEQVILRFHNRQYQRLQETHWHPTQRISIDDDGFVIWQADIAEPKEMLPWIRGWGADVEVIEPLHIRQLIAYEAEATARLYREVSASDEDYIF